MPETTLTTSIRRLNGRTSVIRIEGAVTAASEEALMAAYNEATSPSTRVIILNFEELEYLNSSGIGLLVTVLVRVQRQKQRLLAYGLNEHYRHIFELTRLNDAIGIYADEAEALAAADENTSR